MKKRKETREEEKRVFGGRRRAASFCSSGTFPEREERSSLGLLIAHTGETLLGDVTAAAAVTF